MAKGVAVKTADFGGQNADVLDGSGLFEQGIGGGAGGFAFQGFELLFELFGGLELALEGGDYVVFARVQELRDGAQGVEGALVFGEGSIAGDGFDAADSRRRRIARR